MASRIWRWNGTAMVEVSPWAFSNVAVAGQSTIVADQESDTLTVVGGTGVTVVTNATSDTMTLSIGQDVAATASPTFAGLTLNGALTGTSFTGTGTLTLNANNTASLIHTAVLGAWDGNNAYFVLRHTAAASGTFNFLGTATTTYISTPDAAGDVIIRPRNNVTTYQWVFSNAGTHSAIGTQWTFRPVAADNGIKIVGGSLFCYQAATAATDMYSQNASEGMSYRAGGILAVAAISNTAFIVNRITTDGTLMQVQTMGVTQGTVSIAGTTTTWGAFAGSHWGQLIDNSHPDILRGTVMETIDEMCEWPEESNDQLAKVKVSDTPGSKRVYGVFFTWDDPKGEKEAEEYPNTMNDMNVLALGAFLVRIARGVVVEGGDLLESNGDGCARVQADDLMRASTIAKVTSTNVVETYGDGSYLVPCTIHCG